MSPELNVLQDVIKIINHIKIHALNSQLSTQLYEEMDAEHTRLPLYTEVSWLSKGRSLDRVFELREPLQRFLLEKVTTGSTFQRHRMGSQNLLTCVTYSTCSTNSICHFRGEQQLCSSRQIKWLHSKPNWIYGGGGGRVNIGIFDMFQTLAEILKETEPGPSFSKLVYA